MLDKVATVGSVAHADDIRLVTSDAPEVSEHVTAAVAVD